MRRTQFAAAFAVLLALTVLASAATPTPTIIPSTALRSGDCVLDMMTPQQVQQFWAATTGRGFQGNQMNELNDAQLMNYSPKNFELNATTAKPGTITMVPLFETARVLGLDPNQTAKDLGINVTDSITLQQAQQLGKKKGFAAADITKMLSGVKGTQVQAQVPGDQLQIGLPNGKKISLADLDKLQQMNPDGCMLGSSDVDGQVSYIALLGASGSRGNDYDLNIGYKDNAKITGTNQHIASDNLVAAMSLGEGGANIIIPSQYAKWLRAFSKVNMADLIYNTAMGAALYTSQSRLKKLSDLEKDIATQQDSAFKMADAQRGLSERLNSLQNAKVHATDPAEITRIDGQISSTYDALAKQDEAFAAANAEVVKNKNSQVFAKKLTEFDETIRIITRRANYGLIMGAMWLGPARFLYSVNEGLLFSSDTLNATEQANYYMKVFVNKEVATEFRSATDFLGLGYMLEVLSGWFKINAPHKAFQAGNYFVINNGGTEAAQATQAVQSSAPSTTSFSGKGTSGWIINSRWNGPSDLTVFEKLTLPSDENYSSLSLETNLLPPNAIVTRKNVDKLYAESILFTLPFIITTKLTQIPGRVYTLVPLLLVNELVMKVDHQQFAKSKCDPSVVDNYIYAYGAVVGASNLMNFLPAVNALRISRDAFKYNIGVITPTEIGGVLSGIGGTAPAWMGYSSAQSLGIIDKLMLPQALQVAISSRAQEYVSTCYDDQNQILGYQSLPQAKKSTIGEQIAKMGQPLNNVSQGLNLQNALNINKALDNIAQKFTDAERYEIMNVRAQLLNQKGVVQPAEIYYLHFDASNVRWWNSFEQKCFRECFSKDNYSVCIDGQLGVYAIDPVTGEKILIASPDRAKRQLTSYDLARAFIPNGLIQSTLNCGDNKVMQADALATLSVTDLSCPSMQCMVSKLQELTGRSVNPADLSSIMGKVQKIHTTEGEVDFGAADVRGIASIRFVRMALPQAQQQQPGLLSTLTGGLLGGTANQTPGVGSELVFPYQMAQYNTSYSAQMMQASYVNIFGNGRVTASGLTATGVGEENVGTLLTIQTERGMIDYDPATGRLTITLHQLAALPIEAMKGIQTSVKCEQIRIDRVNPKPGYEDVVSEFNAALQKIQGECGMAVLETPDKIYTFKKDANGNNVLEVFDKKTGQTSSYNITGPARMEGDAIVFPTDKGDIRFRLYQDPNTGQPMLQVTYPDGTQDLGALIAARGLNGMLAFDPRTGTWYAYNGQDIPLNPAFASKGASFYQTPQGLVGQPTDNLAGYSQRQLPSTTNDLLTLLGLPAWPSPFSEWPLFAAMIAAILGGVAAVRLRARR